MKTKLFNNLIFTLIMGTIMLIFSSEIHASTHPWRDEDSRQGYAEDLVPEKENTGEILYAIDNPYKNEVRMSDRIFDHNLKKDITQRYQEKFGRTEAEIIHSRTPYLTSNFSEGASITFNEEQYQKQQQKFGNYVAKRVAEYHFESEAKDNPNLRGAYDTKVALENVSAGFGDFKIRAKYRIASNSIITTLKNPYLNLESRTELSGDKEKIFTASKDLGKKYSILVDYYPDQARLDWIARKSLRSDLSVSLTYTPYRRIYTYEGDIDEQITIAGLNYVF